MLSVIWHFILAVACASGALLIFYYRERRKQETYITRSFFLFFINFALYHLFLSAPYMLAPEKPAFWAAGYIVAVFLVFVIIIPMYEILVFRLLGFTDVKIRIIKMIIIVVGLIASAILIFDFRLPVIHQSQFILWNANLFPGIIVMATIALVVVLWFYIYLANHPVAISSREKIKAVIFTLGSLMFCISCVYFISRGNLILVKIAFIAVSLGTLLYIIDIMIPGSRAIQSNSSLKEVILKK